MCVCVCFLTLREQFYWSGGDSWGGGEVDETGRDWRRGGGLTVTHNKEEEKQKKDTIAASS